MLCTCMVGYKPAARQVPPSMLKLRTDDAGHVRGPVAGVEAADLGPCLAEHRVVGGDGEVADHVQDVAAADAVPRHLRHHRLRQPPYLHLHATASAFSFE